MAETILYDSDEAASLQTVTGWVSRDGRFWGNDEHLARWSGCTHKACACGEITEKNWTICETCREAKRAERYREMPEGNPGGDMVYSDSCQRYFNDVNDAVDFAANEGCSIDSLDLVCCRPVRMREVESVWDDDLPDDFTLEDCAPKAVVEKLREMNALIRESKPVLSWYPDKKRVSDDIVRGLQAELDAVRKVLGAPD